MATKKKSYGLQKRSREKFRLDPTKPLEQHEHESDRMFGYFQAYAANPGLKLRELEPLMGVALASISRYWKLYRWDERLKLANIAISDDALGSNEISLAGSDAPRFEVDGTSLFLKAGTKLDYESKTSYFVRLSASDPSLNGTPSVTVDYRLSVNDIAEFPFISSLNAVKTKKKVTTFSLKKPLVVGGKQLDTAIIGTKKKDTITGSSKNEILAGFKGRDVLRGGHGADGFLFDKPVGFGKKQMDTILDLNVSEHDKILVDKKAFGLRNKIKFKAVRNKSQLKKTAKKKVDFVYESKTGFLYFNENDKKSGWGGGGLFAHLQNKEELFRSSFEIV